jgi:hypothetical protein
MLSRQSTRERDAGELLPRLRIDFNAEASGNPFPILAPVFWKRVLYGQAIFVVFALGRVVDLLLQVEMTISGAYSG